MLPGEHIHDPLTANTGFHENTAGMIIDHLADDTGRPAIGRLPYHRQQPLGLIGRHEGQQLALVGHIKRIEAEQFANPGHRRFDWQATFMDADADSRFLGNFVKRGAHPAPRGVAQDMDLASTGQHVGDHVVERCRVGCQVGFKGQPLTTRENRHAVIRHAAAEDDGIARSGVGAGDVHPGVDDTDAGRVDEKLVRRPPGHHLGVTGDDLDTGCLRGALHVDHHAFQVGHGKALFDDHPHTQVQRHGTAHGHVVDRAVDGQVADTAAGKKQRIDHVGVRGEGDPTTGQIEPGPVVEHGQGRVVESWQEKIGCQAMGHLPATAMIQDNLIILRVVLHGKRSSRIRTTAFSRPHGNGNRQRRSLHWKPCTAPPAPWGCRRVYTRGIGAESSPR
ncbi:hypothetical protein DESC_740219 [Desulfosarcina cetonica]|nr:hypothetical protein DESC_740219 [Desulfosarcina cetonica]